MKSELFHDTTTGPNRDDEDEVASSFLAGLNLLFQYKWVIIFVFLAGLLGSAAYAYLREPIYAADALIQVEQKKQSSIPGITSGSSADGLVPLPQSPVAGEIEIIKSREVIGKAISELGLDIQSGPRLKVPLFFRIFEKRHAADPSALSPAWFGMDKLAWGGEGIGVDVLEVGQGRGAAFNVVSDSPHHWVLSDEEGQVLTNGSVGDLVNFSYRSASARIRIVRINGRIGTSFVVQKLQPYSAYQTVNNVLEVSEVGRGSSVVRAIYHSPSPALAVSVLNAISSAYLEQNVSRGSEEAAKSLEFLDQQLPEIKTRLEESEDRFNAFRLSSKSIDLDKEATALLDQAVELNKTKMQAQLQRDLLLQKFSPTHPDVRSVDTQLETLQGDETRLTNSISRLPETEQQFLRLQRDVSVNASLYTTLLNNSQELKLAKAGTIGNVRIVDFAEPNYLPIGLGNGKILGIGAALGLMLGVAAAFVMRMMRPSFTTAAEIESSLALPVYATVPESREQGRLSVPKPQVKRRRDHGLLYETRSDDVAVEALRSMRAAMQFAMVGAPNKNILITGPTASVGKSFVAANLSAVLAGTGKRILLIETDMRRPALAQYFGLGRVSGLSEFLAGTKTFEEIVQRCLDDTLHVVCAGVRPPNPNELLIQGRLAELLQQNQERYDYIVLDSPPLLPVSDALVVAKMVSTIFLVLRFELSTPAEAIEASRRLHNAGLRPKGIIFNGLKANRLGANYRYAYYYG